MCRFGELGGLVVVYLDFEEMILYVFRIWNVFYFI